jgi:hypothetical protein
LRQIKGFAMNSPRTPLRSAVQVRDIDDATQGSQRCLLGGFKSGADGGIQSRSIA